LRQVKGAPTLFSASHQLVLCGENAYFYGGFEKSYFHVYNFHTDFWKKVQTVGSPPSCRTSFSMTSTPHAFIYLWGGTPDLEDNEDQFIYQFNSRNKEWKKICAPDENVAASKFYGRSADYHKNNLYFFGGRASGRNFTNELIGFNVETNSWYKVTTSGDAPCPRYQHQTCIVDDNLYVIGGGCFLPVRDPVDVYALCLATMVWSRIQTSGETAPEGRIGHSCYYDAASNSIYMLGGFNKSLAPLFDLHKLDLTTYKWSVQAVCQDEQEWPDQYLHWSCMIGGGIYSFLSSERELRLENAVMHFQVYSTPQKLISLAAHAVEHNMPNCKHRKLTSYLPEGLEGTFDMTHTF